MSITWRSRFVSQCALKSIALAACAVMVAARPLCAQGASTNGWFTRAGFTAAYVIPTNPSLSDAPPDQQIQWTPSTTIEVGRQTDGSREWHRLYGVPAYGVGLSAASLGDGLVMSHPVAAYTLCSRPRARPCQGPQVTTDFGRRL